MYYVAPLAWLLVLKKCHLSTESSVLEEKTEVASIWWCNWTCVLLAKHSVPCYLLQITIDRHPVRFFVHKRPHVDYFLDVVSQWYDLVIFTASMEIYGAAVAEKLDAKRGLLNRRYYRQVNSCLSLSNFRCYSVYLHVYTVTFALSFMYLCRSSFDTLSCGQRSDSAAGLPVFNMLLILLLLFLYLVTLMF